MRPDRASAPEILHLAFVLLGASPVGEGPRFFRLPVLGSAFLEYSRYSPDLSFRIIAILLPPTDGVAVSMFRVIAFPCIILNHMVQYQPR